MNGCSREKLCVFPVKLSSPGMRRFEREREWDTMCHAVKGHQSKSKDRGTEGWLGGGEREREATPSMHDPYVREVKSSLALDAETSEGRTEPRLAGRSGAATSRGVRPAACRPTAQPGPPRAGLQHAGPRNRNLARARSRFRHLYCGHKWIFFFFFLLLGSLTRKNISLLVLLLVFRDTDEAGAKKTKGAASRSLRHSALTLRSALTQGGHRQNGAMTRRAGLVAKETRKPEMRPSRWAGAAGGRVGVTGPDREEAGRSWQGE